MSPVYQCVECAKYCAEDGSWLKITDFPSLKAVQASESQPIVCLLCREGFQRQAVGARQLPPSDRE